MDYTEREREQRLEASPTNSVKAALDKLMSEPRAPHAGDPCPRCDGKIAVRNGEWGEFCGCTNYPDCAWTADHIVGRRWVVWTLNNLAQRRLRIAKDDTVVPMRTVHLDPPTVEELYRPNHDDLHVIYYTGVPDEVTQPQGYALLDSPRVLDVLYRQYTRDEMKVWSLRAGFGAAYPRRNSQKRKRRIPLPLEGARK